MSDDDATRIRDADATRLSADERAAMKEYAAERRAEARRARGMRAEQKAAEQEQDALAVIAAMPEPDRVLAERLRGVVAEVAPQLALRTWYGMPAFAADGTVVCFFQAAAKFHTRYATLGFQHAAQLDDGAMWPTAFALLPELGDEDLARIRELVRRAAG